mmetsp:Transcript_6926/g.7558  ORF Transcript_6926/g.7558 Transcript_6926/m.7558 type:complete len:506 (+) Transcript_6926:55-1572(+)|eukprot:gene11499-12536_t
MFFYLPLVFATFHLAASSEKAVHRIAFGSCYNPNKGDEMWKLIHYFSPNQLILLGDQIYADFHPIYKYKHFNGSNPDMIREEYDKFYSQRGFNDLLSSLSHGWVSTYDDHDYGKDNGDRTFKFRDEAIALFARYNRPYHYDDVITLPNAITGEMQTEKKTGVFSSHTYSFPVVRDAVTSDFRYKVVLTDARSNKDVKGTEGGDFLGQQQWRWLEYELSDQTLGDVDLVVFGSGVQLLSDDKLVEESWGEFPEQRQRLIALLSRLALTRNLLLLSGDIHCAEISQMTCLYQGGAERRWQEERRLVELTSSGLSHTFTKIMDSHRMKSEGLERGSDVVGKPRILTKSRSVVAEFFSAMYQLVYPAVYRQDKYGHVYQGLHFGLIDFLTNEEGGDVSTLRFQTISHEGDVVMSLDIPLRPRQTSQLSHSGDDVAIECTPIQGPLTSLRSQWFKGNMVLGVMVFVLLPVLTLLWFVGAAIYYLCVGREIERRERIESQYQQQRQQKKNQ